VSSPRPARSLLGPLAACAVCCASAGAFAEDAGAASQPASLPAESVSDAGAAASQPASRPSDAGAPDRRALPAWAPRLQATVSPAVVKLGQPVEVSITVRHGQGVSVTLPLQLELGKWTELSREERSERPQAGGKAAATGEAAQIFTLRVAAYELGELTLPPIEISALGPRGELVTLATTAMPIKVVSVLRNEPNPKLKGLEDVISVFHRTWWLLYTLCAIAAVALIATVTLLVSRRLRRRREAEAPPPPPAPAHLVALERLRAVELDRYLAEGRFKELYLLLSEILRDYVGRRFGFDALEMTTTEIAEALERRRVGAAVRERCERFFNDCDLVKFAKYIPEAELARAAYQEAEGIVRDTAVVSSPPAPVGPVTAAGSTTEAEHGA
jgi:hypothetical protein